MAHILSFPHPSPDATRPTHRDGQTSLAAMLDALFDALRLAWWDGSSLALSRGGLESLVGLEPDDAAPRRRAGTVARATVLL